MLGTTLRVDPLYPEPFRTTPIWKLPRRETCLIWAMDIQGLRMEIWTSLQLDHIPTLRTLNAHSSLLRFDRQPT